jgi:cytochrome c oxidase subunit III
MAINHGTHHPALAHHFADLEQQKEALNLGMWIFLVTELMIFGGLFTAYTVYRYLYPVAFGEASAHLSWVLASINTVVLISSSFTVVLAVYGAQAGDRKFLVGGLALTMLLGLVFLGIKAGEYTMDVHEKLTPFRTYFDEELFHGSEPGYTREEYLAHVRLFLTLYYIMTGLHALHMIAGLGVLAVVLWRARQGRYTPEYHPGVEMFGLYWHFVDVVWIFLLPLLYLLGSEVH